MEKTNETRYIQPKKYHNYVAFFPTLACNLQCSYCINLHGTGSRYQQAKRANLTPEEWIQATNRLILRDDLPLTFQGGEPTLYKGFYKIVNEVKEEINNLKNNSGNINIQLKQQNIQQNNILYCEKNLVLNDFETVDLHNIKKLTERIKKSNSRYDFCIPFGLAAF